MQTDFTYHVEAGFVVGPHPDRTGNGVSEAFLHTLHNEHITCIIDLTSPLDGGTFPSEVLLRAIPELHIFSYPIPDLGVPSVPLMLAILDCIDTARADQKRIYLHCAAGIGRSGLVVACWLIRHGLSSTAALVQLAALRGPLHHLAPAPETAGQHEFVHNWHEPDAHHATRIRTFRDRYRGALLGLAVGDCLGMPLEFKQPGERIVTGMESGNPFDVPVGSWTDDTSMALCMADSIVTKGGFDPHDQVQRYIRWWKEGLWSSTDRCFDIGITVRGALRRYTTSETPYLGSTDPHTAGNGSLMRLAPIPMAFGYDAALCEEYARKSSATTHGAPTTLDACAVYAYYMAKALVGTPRDVFLAAYTGTIHTHEIQAVAAGSVRTKQPPAIVGSGYVVQSTEAALWAFAGNETYATATLAAVNLARDADTTGAICGMLAGAYWGESAIPAEWLATLARRRDIEWIAEELLRQSWANWERVI